MTSKLPIRVELTRRFRRDIKRLRAKYRHVQHDVQTLIEHLESGERIGDRVQDVKQQVYKVRLRSTDLARGTSGDYRVIYFVKTVDKQYLI